MTTKLQVQRLSGSVGAEISGINLLESLDDRNNPAYPQNLVTTWRDIFRDQPLDSAAFLAFAERFNDVIEYPFDQGAARLSADHSCVENAPRTA